MHASDAMHGRVAVLFSRCFLLAAAFKYCISKLGITNFFKAPVVNTPCAGACPALIAAVVVLQVHFLQISTEEDFSPGSPQWT